MTDLDSGELKGVADNLINIVLSYLPYDKDNYLGIELSDYEACVNEIKDLLACRLLEDYD